MLFFLKRDSANGSGKEAQVYSSSSKPLYGRQLKTLKKESRATRLLAAIIFGSFDLCFENIFSTFSIHIVMGALQHSGRLLDV